MTPRERELEQELFEIQETINRFSNSDDCKALRKRYTEVEEKLKKLKGCSQEEFDKLKEKVESLSKENKIIVEILELLVRQDDLTPAAKRANSSAMKFKIERLRRLNRGW